MAATMENRPTRLPDHASVEAILARLPAGADEAALAAALGDGFPGFVFSTVNDDDHYWRVERSVLSADGSRIAEYRPWMEAELAKDGGKVDALWRRLQHTDFQISEWHGNSAYAFASTGPGVADYVQIALGHEVEWCAGPIVDPSHRPWSQDELLDPSWIKHGEVSENNVITGPLYRLTRRVGSGVIHVRTFLARCARLEREKRLARRAEMEQRFWVGADGRRTPFLQAQPDWFDRPPREVRFFQDWEESSARTEPVFRHWALDINDYEERGSRELGFIPRPLRLPEEKLELGEASVHILMDRIERIDREIGVPFGWFFVMTHGNRVDPDVGDAIARGLREGRVRLPDSDAKVLLRWADQHYSF